jgi:biotin transport system substrate-specific component
MQSPNAHLLERARPIDNPFFGIVEILAVAGALFVAAQIKFFVPGNPIPYTLQTLPVLAAGYVVGRDRAALGIGLYLLIGALFSMFSVTGVSFFAAFSATTGFLAAFALVPFVTASVKRPAAAIPLATLLIYAMGTAWFCVWAGAGFLEAFGITIAPFILGDVVKGFIAFLIARRASREHVQSAQ